MRNETLAVRSGYDVESAMKACAVRIHQKIASAFDAADHGAANRMRLLTLVDGA